MLPNFCRLKCRCCVKARHLDFQYKQCDGQMQIHVLNFETVFSPQLRLLVTVVKKMTWAKYSTSQNSLEAEVKILWHIMATAASVVEMIHKIYGWSQCDGKL